MFRVQAPVRKIRRHVALSHLFRSPPVEARVLLSMGSEPDDPPRQHPRRNRRQRGGSALPNSNETASSRAFNAGAPVSAVLLL